MTNVCLDVFHFIMIKRFKNFVNENNNSNEFEISIGSSSIVIEKLFSQDVINAFRGGNFKHNDGNNSIVIEFDLDTVEVTINNKDSVAIDEGATQDYINILYYFL